MLGQDPSLATAVLPYADDLVDESSASSEEVVRHFAKFGHLQASRVAERSASKASEDWDTPIDNEDLRKHVEEIARRVEMDDLSRGQWCV